MIRFASFLLPAAALLVLAGACQHADPAQNTETAAAATSLDLPGKALYTQNCAVCHGADGKKGLNGAHDLTKSNLNTAGRVYMVTQGLGKMPGFKTQLTDEQIYQVVEYSLTLK
ncbi:c-type cytochrome [Hymenobacter lucidus]|uniref:Cytochrome c n=1 Tax=Hymenobacter lucidus TaxID=2880930 RepID=A0ABS8AL50_9BACT|nr:cytochrome c [Hymenobacter lucidus]MCB2406822.1 cytochrome c [Hymenobacter lucidus]